MKLWGGGAPENKLLVGKKIGFTLAEVLITLGILGVVIAMTMPTVVGKYKKQATISQLKKAYTVLSQLVLSAQEDNGAVAFSSDVLDANTVKKFFEQYWLPYFNSPTVSKVGTFPYNGNNNAYYTLNGANIDMGVRTDYAIGRIFFTIIDGTTYFINMMQWEEQYDEEGNQLPSIAKYSSVQSVYVDLNGIKPPNIFGKDVFIFQVFFDKNIVRPYGFDKTKAQINTNCSINGMGSYCAAKIINDGWVMRNDYPW